MIATVTLGASDNPPLMEEAGEYIKARAGEKTGYWYEFEAFHIIWTLKNAIEAAQSLDPTVVKEHWEQMDTIETVYGMAEMGGMESYGMKHTVVCPQGYQVVKDGEIAHGGWVIPECP